VTTAAGFFICVGAGALAGFVALAGRRVFAAAGFGAAAAGFAAGGVVGAGFFAAAAGFVAAVVAAFAARVLTRFFAAGGPDSFLPVSAVSLSVRTTGGWLSPKGDVTALRALAADAFIANLVAPETSMNEHGLVNRTKNTNRPYLPGRRLQMLRSCLNEAGGTTNWVVTQTNDPARSFTPTITSYPIWARDHRAASRYTTPQTPYFPHNRAAARPRCERKFRFSSLAGLWSKQMRTRICPGQ